VLLTVGAGLTVATWIATSLGLEIPTEVGQALVTLVGAAVLYIGRKKPAA
jgi:hypothetical protein